MTILEAPRTAEGDMEKALALWRARRLGAEPYLTRKGKEWVPDAWEFQECCVAFIQHHGTELIRLHCCEPVHIAHLFDVNLNKFLSAIDRELKKEVTRRMR